MTEQPVAQYRMHGVLIPSSQVSFPPLWFVGENKMSCLLLLRGASTLNNPPSFIPVGSFQTITLAFRIASSYLLLIHLGDMNTKGLN